jgi:Ni/Co efflux regulator RcnB
MTWPVTIDQARIQAVRQTARGSPSFSSLSEEDAGRQCIMYVLVRRTTSLQNWSEWTRVAGQSARHASAASTSVIEAHHPSADKPQRQRQSRPESRPSRISWSRSFPRQIISEANHWSRCNQIARERTAYSEFSLLRAASPHSSQVYA